MVEQAMNHEALKCPFCDGELIWSSDENAKDCSDEYQEYDTAAVSYYLCSRCGRDYEIFEPTKEARENEYKDYWNQ